jgi:hypothetical protein
MTRLRSCFQEIAFSFEIHSNCTAFSLLLFPLAHRRGDPELHLVHYDHICESRHDHDAAEREVQILHVPVVEVGRNELAEDLHHDDKPAQSTCCACLAAPPSC